MDSQQNNLSEAVPLIDEENKEEKNQGNDNGENVNSFIADVKFFLKNTGPSDYSEYAKSLIGSFLSLFGLNADVISDFVLAITYFQ